MKFLPALAMVRRCIVITVCVLITGFAEKGQAQEYPAVLSWNELAAHAGLVGLKPKTQAEFKADVDFVVKRNISAVKAAIRLSGEEWAWVSSSTPNHLLHPWTTDKMDNDLWKSTVDLGLASEPATVDVSRLKFDDKAVILRRPDMGSVRLYLLSPNPDGKSGVLFYFFHSHQ